jgi:TetR/AcrR family transcriptional repressor of nem operon
MGRERQFDQQAVLEVLADCFAANGYQGSSMAMLTEATGLGKQSLYNAFGDKRTAYLQAVDCAVARHTRAASGMAAAASGRAALAMYFDHLLTHCLSEDPAKQTCMVTSGLLEGIDDVLVRETLERKWMGSHEVLRAQVERGQRDGSIKSTAPSAELADRLMLLVSGLRVMARTRLGEARLNQLIRSELASLDHD